MLIFYNVICELLSEALVPGYSKMKQHKIREKPISKQVETNCCLQSLHKYQKGVGPQGRILTLKAKRYKNFKTFFTFYDVQFE